jgi:prepilin-type processing-associated H-X9-DG protein
MKPGCLIKYTRWAKECFAITVVLLAALGSISCSDGEQAGAVTVKSNETPVLVAPVFPSTPFPTQASQTSVPESTLSCPTIPVESKNIDSGKEVDNLKALMWDVYREAKTTGWIHQVTTHVFSPNQQGIDVPPQIFDEWFLFDDVGLLVEKFSFTRSPDGTNLGESVIKEGVTNLLFADGHVEFYTLPDPITIDLFTYFYDNYSRNGTSLSQEAVVFHGTNAWKFSYPFQGAVESIYFCQDSGRILGYDTYLIQGDGSVLFHREEIITEFEVNANPPLEKFRQILERAKG